MARPKVKLNSAGIRDALRSSKMQAAMLAVAEDLAGDVHGRVADRTYKDVDFSVRVTDRAVGIVEIPGHNAGLYQVRDGVLTKAATAYGLKTWKGAKK